MGRFALRVAAIIALSGAALTWILINLIALGNVDPARTAWTKDLEVIIGANLAFCSGLGSLLFYDGPEMIEHY